MNTEKEKSYAKNNILGIFTALIVGLSAGFIAGILLAPKSGKETRQQIKEKSEELMEKSKEGFDTFMGKTREYVDKGKIKLAEMKSKGEEFVERSKGKIVDISRVVGSRAGEAKKKIEKVIEKGKDTAKKVEEDLS